MRSRKPPDFAKKLINLAPSLVSLDKNLRHTLVDVLAATSQENEDPSAELVAATKSPTAIVRALAARSLIREGEIKPAAAARLCENETPAVG